MEELKPKNGSYFHFLSGKTYGSFSRISINKRSCPVCCELLGHDDDMELHEIPLNGKKVRMWICHCFRKIECLFAYPDHLSSQEIQKLVEERKKFLNQKIGIGGNYEEKENFNNWRRNRSICSSFWFEEN